MDRNRHPGATPAASAMPELPPLYTASTPARVGALVGRTGEDLRRRAAELRASAGPRVRAEAEERIRGRPLLSVGLAIVAGFVIGRALRR